jgi:hypothetical protein
VSQGEQRRKADDKRLHRPHPYRQAAAAGTTSSTYRLKDVNGYGQDEEPT